VKCSVAAAWSSLIAAAAVAASAAVALAPKGGKGDPRRSQCCHDPLMLVGQLDDLFAIGRRTSTG